MWRVFTIVVVACGVVVPVRALVVTPRREERPAPLAVDGSHVYQGHRLYLEITERT